MKQVKFHCWANGPKQLVRVHEEGILPLFEGLQKCQVEEVRPEHTNHWPSSYPEYTYVGVVSATVDYQIPDTREKALDALQEQLKDVEAKAEAAVNEIKGQIQNLLAITHEG